MQITHFKEEITPPIGHALCAGWCPPAKGIADRLFAHGVVLRDETAQPMVLCALDWAELSNLEHLRWREALANAVGTSPDRVTVHCVHNHDSPWPDEEAQELLDHAGLPHLLMDREWCRQIRQSVADAAKKATAQWEKVDRLHFGKARVEELASNRRPLGPDGKVIDVRWTQCRNPAIRALPEGIIDPWLRTVSFWQGERKLAALHYYTVHPTSYDGTGMVSNDFVGLARERLIEKEGIPHLYFTGCAGDITAGKYNDGIADNRELFTLKILEAMQASEAAARVVPVSRLDWRTTEVTLPQRNDTTEEELLALISPDQHKKIASRSALELAYRKRIATPITVSALHFGADGVLLHLPGEAFIDYQLHAQHLLPADTWVGVAAYGDLGPGYICLERSFVEGGYEPRDAFCAPESEGPLRRAIDVVLGKC